MNHQQPPALLARPSSFSGGDCGNCGAHLQSLLLHNVRLRGIQRRLCTTCVLRLHPSLFCPVCFDFYDSNPPHPSKRFSCSNCSSFTHSHCLPSPPPPPPYLCPPCAAPSPSAFSFFPNSSSSAVDGGATGGGRLIDSKLAAVLLCAARISSASMAKAVAVARMEAEKKAKEAAMARKKAREALELVGMLITAKSNVNVAQNNSNANGGGGGGGDGSAAASFFKQEVVNNVETETG